MLPLTGKKTNYVSGFLGAWCPGTEYFNFSESITYLKVGH